MSRAALGRRDAAQRLLAGAVRLLPAERRAWGAAMLAELAGITADGAGRGARWSFAVSCIRVVAGEPAARRRAGYPFLAAGVLATVCWWSGSLTYAPLRWGAVGLVTVLVLVSFAGRRTGFLGPVGEGHAPRLLRTGGYLLVAAMALALLASIRDKGNPGEQARVGVPVFTVLLAGCLAGFLAVTARRSAAGGFGLAVGAGAGLAGAGAWTAIVFAVPPIPASIGPALIVAVSAAGLATVAAGRRESPPGQLLAAMTAALISSLLISMAVLLLAGSGPARLIPDLVPAALTPADDLANSRIEIEDPYIGLLALAFLLAVTLVITSVTTRHRKTP